MAVVVGLQIVHVEHHEGEVLAEPRRALHLAAKGHLEEAVVVDLRQIVRHRQLLGAPEELSVLDRDRGVVGEERQHAQVAHLEGRSVHPVHGHENAQRGVAHLERRREARGGAESRQRVGLGLEPGVRPDVGHVERLPLQHHPPGDAALVLDVVALEVVELAVLRHPPRVFTDLPAFDRDEEHGLGVEHLEGAVEYGLEDRLLRPAPVDETGNFLEGGKEQFVLREVRRCRTHDFRWTFHVEVSRCNLHAARGGATDLAGTGGVARESAGARRGRPPKSQPGS